jgi:putative endonuclease
MTYVYILRSISSPVQLYIGSTQSLETRLLVHNQGKVPHTAKFRPWEIVFSERFDNPDAAFSRERQIKGWARRKKEALIAGDALLLKRLSRRKRPDSETC